LRASVSRARDGHPTTDVARLVYRASARRALAEIAAHIARESGSHAVAENFIDRLTAQCERIATLPGLLGRARPELGRDYRSIPFGNYVIFLRYADEDGPRSHLYVVHILHGARDIDELLVPRRSPITGRIILRNAGGLWNGGPISP
jgi:toxin ParE1/3/4